MSSPIRNLLGSTALHVGVACGLGVWAGTSAGPAPRPVVRFGVAERPAVVRFVDVVVPEEESEVVAEVLPDDVPPLEPVAVPPDAAAFEPQPVAEELREVEPCAFVDPHVRVRPREAVPVPAPPPVAFVEARRRDDNAAPDYPRSSVARGEQGEVVLRLSIDASGAVTDVRLERGCGHPRLHRAAIAAAEAWTFEPARRDGVPVASETLVPIEFRIEDVRGCSPDPR